jgi:hypothetical protein
MRKTVLFLALVVVLTSQSLFAQVPSYVPINGLVGYWPFNGNANDESGNGNNGTVNGATLTTDRNGNLNSAYNFENSTIEVSHNPSLGFTPTASFSVSFWFNKTTSSLVYHFMGKRPNRGSSFNWQVAGRTNDTSFGSSLGIGLYNGAISPNGQVNGIWTFLTGIYNNGLWSLYENGQLVVSNTFIASADNICSLTFGNSGNFEFYQGKLDDIGIWNRALNQQEITNLYKSTSSSECLTMTINTGVLSTNPVTYTSSVSIYPNPANDQITIDCGNLANVSGWSIKITNMLGQEVFSQPMNTQQYLVPLNTWSGQGMYFVKIINAQNEVVNIKKIILH